MKKKQTWIQTLAAITLASSTIILPVGSLVSAEEGTATDTEQLIVKYKTDKELSDKQLKNIGVESVHKDDELGLYDVKAEAADTAITQLEAMENVEYVEKNVIYKTAETMDVNDTYYKNQWNLSAIDAKGAWEDVKDTSKLVKVAVLDTGVQGTHEDLVGRVLEGKTFVDGYEEAWQGDDQGHGTFVSGIIAAHANNGLGIAGVAGEANVQILPVKVMNKSGVGEAFNIAQGIEYAVDQGVDVINMSLSGEYSETIEKAVQKATKEGVVVIAASGNGGGNADASYPAALPNVLSVGAIATKDQMYERSNYGSTLDIVAPGVSVLSTSIRGDLGSEAGHYSTGSGTSYAAPHVAAVAALYKLKHPEASVSAVEEALTSTATDLNEEGWDEKTGHGKLNAKAALADDVQIPGLSFVLPKSHANVVGDTTVEVALNDASISETHFYKDEVKETNALGKVEVTGKSSVQYKWDTTKVTDGTHEIIAVAVDTNGREISRVQTSVKVVNAPKSGYMFTVKTPTGTIAKGTSVKLYEKVTKEDDSSAYSYHELWKGTTDTEGAVRVPSHVGTDLKNVQVVVQGKFDTSKGNTWFMYSREVASSGVITLQSENTVPVSLNTVDEEGKDLPGAQYFIAMKDSNQTTLGSVTMINETDAKESPTVYLDKGAYNVFSYHKTEGKTYFLSNTAAEVGPSTKTLAFDSRDAGEVAIDNRDKGLVNGVLYLYNDAISEAIGTDEVITGQKFFVSPGDYDYLVDAEVKDPEGKENWVYIFANDKTKAVIKKNQKTIIKAGGSIDITKFEPDQETLKKYYKQRGLTYIERPYPNIAYKLDKAFYTKQTFGDEFGNKLAGMYRGSLDSKDALYIKDVATGKTVVNATEDEAQIEALNFGDLYSKYKVTRVSDNKVMLDSHAKNPTNPANRQYYFYSFWVTSSSDVTEGKYEISLSLDANPLANKGLNKSIRIDMQDSGTTMQVKNKQGNNVAAYITINRLDKTEDGDTEWTQSLSQNTDATKSLSIPSNLELSKEENGNVAIIRYIQSTGEYAYLFRPFKSLDELNTISIPDTMQKVTVSAMDGNKKLDSISTRLWMIKKPVKIGGETTYVTANNLQNYKYDSVYLEPGTFVMEGNYVSLPDENNQKANYYFVEPAVTIEENKENTVVFDKEKLAQVKISADATGYSDIRGAIVYPYNEYSHSFIKTLRVGHTFYVPSNLAMNLQVQLGFGDNESKNTIWNYFLSKGDQTFSQGQTVNWQVGGDIKANISLAKTKLIAGDELSGHTSFEDAYGNTVSSVLVNQSTDYSVADDALVAYEKKANGQIIEKAVKSDYTISHGGDTASASSVKPVLRIYNGGGDKVFEEASLDYYGHIHTKDLNLTNGHYRAELGLAASPKGPVLSDLNSGLFQVGKGSEQEPPQPGEGGVVPAPQPGDSGIIPAPQPEKKEVQVPTVSSVTDQTTVLKGNTTPEAIVVLKKGKETIQTAKADKNGKYMMKIAKQKAGTKLSLSATHPGYATSKVKTIIVLDRTAPTVKPVNVTDKMTAVTVVTEKNVTMTFTAKGKTYTKPVYKNSKYTVKIAKLPAGTKWTLVVQDQAGNQTKQSGIVLDRTAPKPASVDKVTTKTMVVTGKAEKKATVVILKGNSKVATGKTDAKGAFAIKVPKQKAETILQVVVIDAANNHSKVSKVKVRK